MIRDLSCIKQFKYSLVNALKAADIDGVGENVYLSRVENVWPEEAAVIVVGVPNISFDDGRSSPRQYTANADVNVDIYARSFMNGEDELETGVSDFLDNTAKTICELIEPCQNAEGPFNGLVKRCVLKSFANNLSEKSETERGAMRIVFNIGFSLCVNYDVPVDEFLKAKNTMKFSSRIGDTQVFETNLRP